MINLIQSYFFIPRSIKRLVFEHCTKNVRDRSGIQQVESSKHVLETFSLATEHREEGKV
jgi:hypothetical protein